MGLSFSKTILHGIGWHLPANFHLDTVRKCKKLIVVISHTSYWDFFILLLFRQCDERIRKNLYIVIKPQPFKTWGWFLRPLGAIPATKAEDSKGGFVQRLTQKFHNKSVRLIISPEGMMESNPWRSGYYYLCKGLKADIIVAGVDYERKTLHVGPLYTWDEIKDCSRGDLEEILQEEMGEVVPLYPEHSHTPITRTYDANKISTIDIYFFILLFIAIVIIIIIIILLCRGDKSKKSK